jgi:TPR repeat protein
VRPPLFTSTAVSLAYRRIGDELYACMVDGGTGCTPSAGARDGVASALSQTATAAQEAASAAVVDRQRRCDANVGQACGELASHYLEAPSKDSARAAALARRACDLGDAAGCFTLSSLYGSGDGLPRDEARALATNARAEELARAGACGAGGSMEGCIGIIKGLNASNAERSTALAPDTARASCEQGDPLMCMDLARLYFTGGPTVAKDPAKAAQYQGAAMRLWKDACERGVGSACRTVAVSLARPAPGEAPDFDRAAAYAKRGCNDDHDALSCVMLGGMYERGEGVTQDAARGKRCSDDNARALQADAETPGCP